MLLITCDPLLQQLTILLSGNNWVQVYHVHLIGYFVHEEEPGRQLAKLIFPNFSVCLDSDHDGYQRRYFAYCCPWLLHKSKEAINPGQRPTNKQPP